MNYPRPDSGLCKAVDSASLSNPAYETVWLNYWLAADLSCRAANVHQLVFRLDSSACMPTLTWEWGKTSPGQRFHPPSYEVVEAYQASPYHHDAGMLPKTRYRYFTVYCTRELTHTADELASVPRIGGRRGNRVTGFTVKSHFGCEVIAAARSCAPLHHQTFFVFTFISSSKRGQLPLQLLWSRRLFSLYSLFLNTSAPPSFRVG